MSTWTLLGIIYGVCLIPAILLTWLVRKEIKHLSTIMLFVSILLVLPLFPVYLILKKKSNG